MKIKEAVNIINNSSDNIVVAKVADNDVIEFKRSGSSNFFLRVPIKAFAWCSVYEDWDYLYDIKPADLARVMDVVQRLLDTPVKERFPEKSYLLVAKRKPDRPGLPKYVKTMATGVNEFNFYLTDDKNEAEIYKESVLEGIKKREPSLAPAIDAMKEPAEDKTDDND